MTTFAYLKPFLLANLKAGLTPALLGEPGIGKTAFLENLANDLNTKVFVLSVNQLAAKEDLTGARLVPTKDKSDFEQKFYPHQVIGQAIRYAAKHPDETPILFMDEFNRTESDVTSALFTMITERKVGNRALPDNLRIVVAGNDSGNVQAVDDASTSRLVIYHAEPDIQTLLSTTKFNPYIKRVLKDHPDLPLVEHEKPETEVSDDEDADISDFMESIGSNQDSFKQMTTPRTIENLSKELYALGIQGNANDIQLITKYAGDVDSFKDVLYGISGKTSFTNYVINELLNTATKKQVASTNTIRIKHKLTQKDAQLLRDMIASAADYSELLSNINMIDMQTCYKLFELLIAPDVANDLLSNGVDQGRQVYALKALAEKAGKSKNANQFAQLIARYGSVGFNMSTRQAFDQLDDTNPIKLIYSTFM